MVDVDVLEVRDLLLLLFSTAAGEDPTETGMLGLTPDVSSRSEAVTSREDNSSFVSLLFSSVDVGSFVGVEDLVDDPDGGMDSSVSLLVQSSFCLTTISMDRPEPWLP